MCTTTSGESTCGQELITPSSQMQGGYCKVILSVVVTVPWKYWKTNYENINDLITRLCGVYQDA